MLKHDFVAALVALPPLTANDCIHPLVELLSIDGRTLTDAVRVCACCSSVVGDLSYSQIEAILERATKLVRAGWEQYVDLLVACEESQTICTPAFRDKARAQVAKLVGEAYARKWGRS